jgi:putative ABC transport system permease protein
VMLSLFPASDGVNDHILIKIKTYENLEATLKFIQSVAREIVPAVPLSPSFLSERMELLYEKEQKLSLYVSLLLYIAVALSVVGLVGLASFVVEQKTKEIGIRKVLGAEVRDIIALVSQPFMKLVLVAFIVGSIFSSYLMNLWLQGFAYKISIQWPTYVWTLAGLVSLLLFTVGYRAWKAAGNDPVESIRME